MTSASARQVNGAEMPSGRGAEFRIHRHIGLIKERDERIIVKFEGMALYLICYYN